jgi:ParB family chromosome partitioning protein
MASYNKINVFEIGEELKEVEKLKEYARNESRQDVSIKLIDVNPYQPRKMFDEVKLQELATSIKTYGVISPILLRRLDNGRYQILAGERRFRASKIAGLDRVPAIVAEFDDKQMLELSIIENIQREELNVIEEAKAYENLCNNLGLTHEQIGQRVGKSRSYIANIMRLLNLPKVIQDYVINGVLTMGQVKPLINLSESDAIKIANDAIELGYTSRQIEALANLAHGRQVNKIKTKTEKEANPYYDYVANSLHKKFKTKVKIKDDELRICFKNEEDLRRIMENLTNAG